MVVIIELTISIVHKWRWLKRLPIPGAGFVKAPVEGPCPCASLPQVPRYVGMSALGIKTTQLASIKTYVKEDLS
jgi:hypothetical protein